MDTPADSQTGGTTIRGNKPDTYHGDRNKLEAWLLQVDRYFHLDNKIEEADKVVWATTFFRGDAEKWANPIIRRYMDDSIEDTENKELVEDWDTFKNKMKEIFSPFKESVIAEQKIQKLRQTHSAADYTTEFQRYKTAIEWDDNALMRMYRQGLKPSVRMELMRSGSSLNTLNELMAEAIRVDNELYELKLEERLFTQGTRAPGTTNARQRQQPRRSYPNQGRQRSYTPRNPGVYATNGYEPMHLDNLNKGPGKPKFQHGKGSKKKITCYACGKEGHIKRDCRSQGKVVRQLNVLHRAAPDNDSDEEWNVVTRATVLVPGQTDEIVNGIDDLTIITKEEPTSDEESTSETESCEDLEATEIDQTKFGKMAEYQETHRPATPYAPEEQMKTLSSQVNQLLRYLNKPPIEYAYETPDIMAAMRQDFYNLSQQVEQDKENLPAEIVKFLPTPDELDWISKAIQTWNEPEWAKAARTQWEKDQTVVQCPRDLNEKINILLRQLGRPEVIFDQNKKDFYNEFEKYNQYTDLLEELRDQGVEPAATIEEAAYDEFVRQWNKDAEASWKEPTHYLSDAEKEEIYEQLQRQMANEQVARQERRRQRKNDEARKRNEDTHYWMDCRNPAHSKLSWTACLHDHCTIHYSDKSGASYYPRKFVGMPMCAFQWFDCPRDTCATHLWDKRHSPYFHGHEDPQETLQMHMTQQKDYEDGTSAWECNQPSWHTCLNIECDLHIVAKEFYGFGKQSFLDGRPIHLEPLRRSTH